MKVHPNRNEAIFRVNIQDLTTKKMKGFNIYSNGKRVTLIDFVNKIKKKVEETDE